MFERDWNVAGRDYVQTLEPRAFYVYVPYKNQNQAPVFDTALDDFNFGQLFSVNRYIGNDRIADANQLTLALSSRLIDSESGVERLRVAVGERFYFEDQRVVLTESPRSAATSDFLLGIEGRLSDAWSMIGAVAVQLRLVADRAPQCRHPLHAVPRPGDQRQLHVRHPIRRPGDPAVEAEPVRRFGPMADQSELDVLGRWNYSLVDHKTLEGVAGRRVQCRVLGPAAGRPAADDDDADDDQFGLPADRVERPCPNRHEPARSPAPQRPGLPEDQRSHRVAARARRLLSRILRLARGCHVQILRPCRLCVAALWAIAAFALTSAAQSPAPPASPPAGPGRRPGTARGIAGAAIARRRFACGRARLAPARPSDRPARSRGRRGQRRGADAVRLGRAEARRSCSR